MQEYGQRSHAWSTIDVLARHANKTNLITGVVGHSAGPEYYSMKKQIDHFTSANCPCMLGV
jgi:hypothetical protein